MCSDGLTSMVAEDRVAELARARTARCATPARALVDAANDAGGRDNITVVLFRLEEVPAAGAAEPSRRPRRARPRGGGGAGRRRGDGRLAGAPSAAVREAWRPSDAPVEPPVVPRAPLPPRAPSGPPRRAAAAAAGCACRRADPGASSSAASLVGFYFASQTVYFVGTTPHGFVTVYRGLPYELPAAWTSTRELQSGVPAASLPARQRDTVTDHKLRSQGDAHGPRAPARAGPGPARERAQPRARRPLAPRCC